MYICIYSFVGIFPAAYLIQRQINAIASISSLFHFLIFYILSLCAPSPFAAVHCPNFYNIRSSSLATSSKSNHPRMPHSPITALATPFVASNPTTATPPPPFPLLDRAPPIPAKKKGKRKKKRCHPTISHYKSTHRLIRRKKGRQTDRQTESNERAGRETDRQTDRQRQREIEKQGK